MSLATVHQKKLYFNEILSRELYDCGFDIEAYYESSSSNKVASVITVSDTKLKLGINASFKSMDVFSRHSDPIKMSLIFRAYYIVALIRCLEGASKALPDSYHTGLITLRSVIALSSGKRTEFFIPNVKGKNKAMTAIDAFCAQRAMTRMMIEHRDILDSQVLRACGEYNEILTSYLLLPEVEYVKGRAEFSSARTMSELGQLISSHPDITSRYAVFEANGIRSLDIGITATDGLFWQQMILRLSALSGAAVAISSERFDRDSVEYAMNLNRDSILLNENMNAIKLLSDKIHRYSVADTAPYSGRLRRIR